MTKFGWNPKVTYFAPPFPTKQKGVWGDLPTCSRDLPDATGPPFSQVLDLILEPLRQIQIQAFQLSWIS